MIRRLKLKNFWRPDTADREYLGLHATFECSGGVEAVAVALRQLMTLGRTSAAASSSSSAAVRNPEGEEQEQATVEEEAATMTAAEKIAALEARKSAAVAAENYDEAKRLKILLSGLTTNDGAAGEPGTVSATTQGSGDTVSDSPAAPATACLDKSGNW